MTPVAETLDWRARAVLEEEPDRTLVAAIIAQPHQARPLARTLGLQAFGVLDHIDAILTRATAADLLAWAQRDDVVMLEPIEDAMAGRVADLLTELWRVALYDNLGSFLPAVLNLSIGVPRQFLASGLTADRAVHRALETIVTRHGIPVVMSIGNDGPAPGLVNPWALARGVFVVGATDETGTHLWHRSSRFTPGAEAGHAFFVAHGENTVGALPLDRVKTAEQQAAEAGIDMAALVGAENVAHFSVESGTSFAAGKLSHAICLVHQAIAALRARASAGTAVGTPLPLDPFIRAYIDSGFDRSHPIFANRLADERRHYGPLSLPLAAPRKQQFWTLFVDNAIDIRIRYTPETVCRALLRAARPVGDLPPSAVGAGFVSWDGVAAMLRALRMSDLVTLFADPVDPRQDEWRAALAAAGDPLVFDHDDIGLFDSYCQNNDLVLGLRLSGPPTGR